VYRLVISQSIWTEAALFFQEVPEQGAINSQIGVAYNLGLHCREKKKTF